MSSDNERDTRTAYAVLAVAALAVAGLVWRSYRRDAPRIENYTLPPAPLAQDVRAVPRIDSGASLEALAEGHRAAGRFGEAVLTYRKLIALDPKSASLHNELGLALHYDGKSAEAIETLKKATALDPKLQRAWLSLGFVLKSTGQDARAAEALRKTIALDPSTPQGREALGMLSR